MKRRSAPLLVGMLLAAAPPLAAQARPAPWWSGLYVGANAGGSWSRFTADPFTITINQVSGIFVPQRGVVIVPGTTRVFDQANTAWAGKFTGGVNVGYNAGSERLVWGAEADLDAISRRDATRYATLLPNTALTSPALIHLHRQMKVNWTGSLRARVGRIWAGTLFYATGGVAGARVTVAGVDTGTVGPSAELAAKVPSVTLGTRAFNGSDRSIQPGWTVGIGGERTIARLFGVAVEYRYTRYTPWGYDVSAPQPDTTTAALQGGLWINSSGRIRLTSGVLTARVNYHLPGW